MGFIKIVIFLVVLAALFVLGVLLLPLLILLYLFLPQRSTAWFNAFSHRKPRTEAGSGTEAEEEEYYQQIPASQDVIDVKAEEIEEKESK